MEIRWGTLLILLDLSLGSSTLVNGYLSCNSDRLVPKAVAGGLILHDTGVKMWGAARFVSHVVEQLHEVSGRICEDLELQLQ